MTNTANLPFYLAKFELITYMRETDEKISVHWKFCI